MSDFEVSYSGVYPNLCSGTWKIRHKGMLVYIYERRDFNTYGVYDTWEFNDNWSEEWSSYYDGLGIDEWVEKVMSYDINDLKKQLSKVMEVNEGLLRELYPLINEKDWRNNSCGGCI